MSKIVNRNITCGKTKTVCISVLFVGIFLSACVHQSSSEIPRVPAASSQRDVPLRFEQCSSPNRIYLEDQIQAMPPEYFRQSHENEWSEKIPIRCIQIAQRNFSGHFAKCEESNARPTTNAFKPCMTENYTTLTYNAYHDVMDCFNLKPKDSFLQIMIESGFHVNAINKTGFDSGMSQFTANGIKRVIANNLVERTRRLLLESSRASCQRVASTVGHFDIDSFSVKNRCSMMMIPENPYRAMVFNYLHSMLDRISIDDLIEKRPELNVVMTEKIKRHLIYLAYNRGITGVARLLDGYIQSRKDVNHDLVSEDFELDINLSDVKRILKSSKWKRARLQSSLKIKNLFFAEYAVINGATYVSDMADASEYAQKILGDECGGL